MALVQGESDKYDVLEVIGRGAFGIIRKVRRKTDGYILCRKEINYLKMSTKERDQLQAEFSILSSLRHENIVGYYHREHLKQTQELYLYMEYCGGGDLGMVIKNLKKTGEYAKEEFVWRIFSQLITALYRCHYGIDAPEPGSDLSRQKDPRTGLKSKTLATMILHRDLKPENIFLGEDQSVKLGDFGLSKLMQSHDFASTYVGTPFYMSPEICAAEKYTLQSDVWSVGCIMYELCTKEPPFNANSHIQLVQRIRKGDFKPIPKVYSQDLANVISSCLKTNPLHRPDTASLLTIPYVWIARKSQEIVQLGAKIKTREDVAEQKMKEADERLSSLEADKETMRAETEATVRREWEVKARLEIDRQVQQELERLRKKFDKEVEEKVAAKLAQHNIITETVAMRELLSQPPSRRTSANLNPHSSTTTASGEEDFPSTTDLTDLSELSIHSPASSISRSAVPRKRTKTPFVRSKTSCDSPADIMMAEPSPMSISGLALSPRRNAIAQVTADKAAMSGKNIFAEAVRAKRTWEPRLPTTSDDESEDDSDSDILDLHSPTAPRGIPTLASTDPFKLPFKARPGLMRQHTTATMQKLTSQPSLFPTAAANVTMPNTAAQVRAGMAAGSSIIPRSATDNDMRPSLPKPVSPNRRLSKIPSRADLATDAIMGPPQTLSRSPSRKALVTGTGLQSKLASAKTGKDSGATVGGRTLVELAQARAGGRPVATMGGNVMKTVSPSELMPAAIWDPETLGDDMPSPFLKREVRGFRGLR